MAENLRLLDACISSIEAKRDRTSEDAALEIPSELWLQCRELWAGVRRALLLGAEEEEEGRGEGGRVEKELAKAKFERDSAENLAAGLKKEVSQLSKKLAEIEARSNGTGVVEIKIEDSSNGVEKEQNSDYSVELSKQSGVETSERNNAITGTQESASDVAMETGGDEYVKMEHAVLYYHKTSGYLYNPETQQFYSPSSYSYNDSQTGQTSQTSSSKQSYPLAAADGSTTAQAGDTTQYYTLQTSQTGQTTQTSDQTGQTGQSGQTGQTGSSGGQSVAEMLATVSDSAVQRSGYAYDEKYGMYYDARLGLYYHQESKLYYDAEQGTYLYYNTDTKKYEIHSSVRLPPARKKTGMERGPEDDVIDLCSDDEDQNKDCTLEEGEVWQPELPSGSPPPEDEWAPCVRLLVKESQCVAVGTLFVVTQEGANIGREPSGLNAVKLPEVQVSKSHVAIGYHRRRGRYTVRDTGSVNGTFLNTTSRLSQAKESSKPRPLYHDDTLTVGTTTFLVHMHCGWETCESCDPALWSHDLEKGATAENLEPIDLTRRKELNRIKKKYGLRAKDTFGESEGEIGEDYSDRASARRKTVGSDNPAPCRPDEAPSSVHRRIGQSNKGHQMMEKMGWHEGEGLGKESLGRAEPIAAEVRDEKAGLGTSHASRSLDNAAPGPSSDRSRRMKRHFDEVVIREKKRKF